MRKFLAFFLVTLILAAAPAGGQEVRRRPIFASSSTLNTGLVAYWKMDEASGTRADDQGSNDLTDNNTVTSNTGKIGNAGQFTAANSEYLSLADNADLSTGDIDFTFAMWVYGDTLASGADFRGIISKWEGSNQEYILQNNGVTSRLIWSVGSSGSNRTDLTASSFGAPSTSTWYFIVCGHDAANDQIFISVNDGTVDTASHSGGVFNGASAFEIGHHQQGFQYWDGRVDEVGFWKKKLSAAEITELYNAGAGKTCCPFN